MDKCLIKYTSRFIQLEDIRKVYERLDNVQTNILLEFMEIIENRIESAVLTKSGYKDIVWDISKFNSYPHIVSNEVALYGLCKDFQRRGFFSLIIPPNLLYVSWYKQT